MRRTRSRRLLALWIAWLGGAVAACSDDGTGPLQPDIDEQAELQALLRDAPLSPGLASALARPDDGVGTQTSALTAAATSGPPTAVWRFEDCVSQTTRLADENRRNLAFRSVNVACTAGIRGQGVALAATEDIVYAPDQPSFTFEAGVTVAGWFKPAAINGTRTLFRKRDRGTSSFALVLNGGKFQFVASFGPGRAASVTAPARAKLDVYQHVAATYDGNALRLFVEGIEVNRLDVAGTIPVGAGPLLMGNDGSERRFHGAFDDVVFATHALTADEVLQLTCLPAPPEILVTTPAPPPTPVGGTVEIGLAFINHNPAVCAPLQFHVFAFGDVVSVPQGVEIPSAPVPSGATGHITVTAAPPSNAEPGDEAGVGFDVIEPVTGTDEFRAVSFLVAAATGCQARVSRELMMTSLSVVGDPVRTHFDRSSSDPRNGAWTFRRLIENLAPTPADAPALVEAAFASFGTPQVINGFTVASRPGMRTRILRPWPRSADGALDLAQAPLRLQAIVNRLDLRNLANGDAGEARFVFAFLSEDRPIEATLILEYKLPAATEQDVLDWAQAFHALGGLDGEPYNAALQVLTDRFAGRGARPGHPNGSALNVMRTNEIDFSSNGLWELRQFRIDAGTGRFTPTPVDLTPDRGFDGTPMLASYINNHEAEILAGTHIVPEVFDGQRLVAGAVFNDLSTWFAPGVNPDARHQLAVNTCNGCHSEAETGTQFLQIEASFVGGRARLSRFLTGISVADPVTGVTRRFDDLGRRKQDLESIVCAPPAARRASTLRQGIRRVH